METEKRKRVDDGEILHSRRSEEMTAGDRVDDGEILDSRRSEEMTAIEAAEAVKDEEVEEFFAILRRIQVAVKYFEKNDGKRWKPSFQKEDFDEVNCHIERRRKEEGDHHLNDSTGLDLNSDPPSEEESVKH